MKQLFGAATLRTLRVAFAASVVPVLLAACAQYAPKPLPTSAAWSAGVGDLRVDTSEIALPKLAVQHIDIGAPLSMQAVAALAVLNDPKLQAARDRLGVARAQAFSAGLLPDPQFSASRDIPQGQSTATSTAYNLGLSFDLGRLITRGAAVAGARANLKSVDLELLWEEWQTAASAELAYVNLVGIRSRDYILRTEYGLLSERRARDMAAVQQGYLPRTTADADLVALQALGQRLWDDQLAMLKQRAALNALLGLDPRVKLRLAGLPRTTDASLAQVDTVLEQLPRVRPDLMALRAGYESQEQRVRESILKQFPSFSVGFTRARDTSSVNTLGFGVSFSLPIFDGGRGAIAVARATRQQLYDAYRVRLSTARSDAEQALEHIRLLRAQQRRVRAAIPALASAAHAADVALDDGNLTMPQAQAQRMALLEQQLALLTNEQQTAEQTVVLQLLTGRGAFGTLPSTPDAQQSSAS